MKHFEQNLNGTVYLAYYVYYKYKYIYSTSKYVLINTNIDTNY